MSTEITCSSCQTKYSAKDASCPECQERNPKRLTWSQKIIYGTLAVALLAWGIQGLTDPFARQGSPSTPSPAASAPKEEAPSDGPYLPGPSPDEPFLLPVDIYLALEKEGFSVKKTLDPENGCLWENAKEQGGFDLNVTSFSPKKVDRVQSITVNAMANDAITGIGSGRRSIKETQWLFNGICTLAMMPANAKKAEAWIAANFSKKNAETTIGQMRLEIHAPTAFARIMCISAL